MAKQIFAAEVSFENVPLPIRKRLPHTDGEIKRVIELLRGRMDEVFILSTSNRFAIYALGDSIDPLVQFYLKDPEIFPFAQLYRSTEASVHHLFATASGLCSRIKGEHDIITPIKHARQIALACNSVGLVLDNFLREAVRVGRFVRSETGIDKFCSSVVDSGFSLLYERFDNLHNKKFLLIGTDRIARLALEHLGAEGIQNVSIFNSEGNRGEALAAQYNAHFVQPDEVGYHFMTADVIIVGTNLSISLEPRFFDDSWIRHIADLDIDKRRVILDFGMPHDTQDSPAPSNNDDMALELYTLDDLQILVPQKLHPFGEIVDTAWRIISSEADEFLGILQQLELAPLLTVYWSRLPLKDEQLDWLLPRIESATRKDIEEIRRYAYGLAWNASRDPLKNVLRYVSDRQVKVTQEAMRSLDSFASIKLNLSDN